jgi:putative PEP-CTERM system TPR-repeat lipoprotein
MALYRGVTHVLLKGAAVPAVVVTATLLLTGCGDIGKTADEFVQSAQEHRLDGDLNAAVIDLKSALQKNPDSAAARFMLGEIYLDVADGASAEKELMRARELGMGEGATDLPLARAWLLQGQNDRVLNDLPLPAENGPQYLTVLVLRGQALLGLGRPDVAEEVFNKALAKAPDSLEGNIGLARVAMARRDLDKAAELQAKAEKIDPAAVEGLSLKGDLAFLQKDYAEAAKVYGAMVKRRPQNLQYRISQAWAQVAGGDNEDAAKSLDTILRVTPDNGQVQYLRGLVHYNVKQYEQARGLMDKVLAQKSDYAPALLVSGASSYALKQYEQARNNLTRFVSLAPKYEQGRRLLALTQMQLGQTKAAAETLKPLMVAPEQIKDEQTLRLVAVAALQSGDLKSGKNYIEQAVERAPDDARLRAQLGLTKISLGETESGLEDVQSAIGQDSSLESVQTGAFMSLLREGQYDQALDMAKKMQEAKDDDAWRGYIFEGMAHDKLGNIDLARTAFEKAYELNPASPAAANNLATLAIRAKDLDTARKIYQEFLEKNPDNAFMHFQLAKLEAVRGDAKGVEDHLLKVIKLQPESPQPRAALGKIYLELKRPQDALSIVEEVLQDNARDSNLLSIMGQAQLQLRRGSDAADTFQRVTALTPTFGAYYWLAAARREAGDIAGARTAIDQSLSLKSDNPQARLLQGQLAADGGDRAGLAAAVSGLKGSMDGNPLYENLVASLALMDGKVDEARATWQEVLAKAPASDVLVKLAMLDARTGRQADAEKQLKDWLAEHPTDQYVRLNLSSFYSGTGRYADAQEQLETLLKANPDMWAAKNDLAWVLYQQGDLDEAARYAESASEAEPDNASVLDTYGTILLARKSPEKAAITLEKAVRLDPANPGTRMTLVKAYAQSNQKDKALSTLNRLLGDFQEFQGKDEAEKLKAQLAAD